MNISFRKILLSCCCCFVCALAVAQVKLYSIISPGIINKDGIATYRIVLENASGTEGITAPVLKDFFLINGPSREMGFGSVNGQTIQYVSLTYVLKPKKSGTFAVGSAVATIGGKRYKGNAVTLIVKNGLSGNGNQPGFDPYARQSPRTDFSDYIFRKGDNVTDKVNRNMQLRLEVDKTTCYVGEPVVAAYKIYTRLKSDSKLTQTPSFNGFSVIDMQQPGFTDYAKEKLNGREYNVYTLRKAQLYALQPGVIGIEPAELENNIQFIKDEYAKQIPDAGDMFNDFATSLFPPEALISQSVTLKSNLVNIRVKPLPEENKPASFKGAVGNFEIAAALLKPTFSTDEAGKLTVTITGSGNMQLLTAPDIEWPKGIEIFEPKFSDSLVNITVPVSGNKRFEYSFAANDSGHYILPAIRFSYFDPVAATYRTIATAAILFQVSKGDGHPVALTSFAADSAKPSFLNGIFLHRWWIVIFIGIVMLTGLFMWRIKEKRAAAGNSSPAIIKEDDAAMGQIIEASAVNQQNVFSETEKCLYQDDCFGFYALLNMELKAWLANRFSVDPNAVNSNSIVAVMDKKGIPNDIALKLQQLMQDVEWQLYTPFERNDRMNELYQQAHEIVQLIYAHHAMDL